MRTHGMLICLLSLSVVGCAGAGMSAGGGQLAGTPTQAKQLAALNNGYPSAQQRTSWTQRVTNVFTPNSTPQLTGPSVPPAHPELDPISLGFASGPPNAELYLSMAKLSDQGGNAAHARSMYQRALTIQADNLDGMLALARLEDREGQLDAALHYYKQAVQMHPQSARALNDISLCYARRGQLADALPPLEQAIRLQPAKQLYRNNIAKVLAELNRVDVAVQHLAAVHPPAIAQYNMGVLLHQRGRDVEAIRFLTAATQADPNLAAAQTLLAQLTGGSQQVVQRAPSTYDHVLPTPRTTPYPSTRSVSASPAYQTVPAETAHMPFGRSPVLLPPAR